MARKQYPRQRDTFRVSRRRSIRKEHKVQNQGSSSEIATLGKIARGGACAAPTIIDAPTTLHPVSQATIDRLLGKTSS
jgi:hypothetical protein